MTDTDLDERWHTARMQLSDAIKCLRAIHDTLRPEQLATPDYRYADRPADLIEFVCDSADGLVTEFVDEDAFFYGNGKTFSLCSCGGGHCT